LGRELCIRIAIDADIRVQADSGYQGIESLHKNSETPKKKSKKHPLTEEEKASNRKISRERIVIENVNAVIKVFKIMARSIFFVTQYSGFEVH
jgi:IS5 family transposase